MAVDTAYLTDKQREEYSALVQFFESSGWKFIKGMLLRNRAQAVNRALAADNFAENRVARGELNVINGMLQFEAEYETQFANMANEARQQREIEQNNGAFEDFA